MQRLKKQTMNVLMRLLVGTLVAGAVTGFQLNSPPTKRSRIALKAINNDEKKGFPNPLKELGDMFSSWDDVIEDFLFKRMGNGEVFYGKRKYKPSGRPNTEGKYAGMGMTDKLKIDITRNLKEELVERRRQQQNERKQVK